MYEINEKQIRTWWSVFKGDGKLVEIRLLGKNAYSGYFTDIDTLITKLRPLLDYSNVQYYGNMQAYFTLNEINPDLYSREQRNEFVKKPKSTTTDSDIVRRTFVMIDLDPQRAAGISASDAEFEKAHLKCVDVYRYLINEGFNEPIISKSGNGWHCYLPCDMPNDEKHNELIKRFLQAINKLFGDNNVEIDEKVFNPARIDKLVGTWAKKGSDSKERKWRIAEFAKIPEDLSPNKEELFEKIAALAPKEERPQQPQTRARNWGAQPFNLQEWLDNHGIKYRVKTTTDSTLFELEYCPWVDTHSDRKKWDSALFQDKQGKITFNCTHSHCKDKTWHDVRLFYEPNAYDQPPQQYYQPQRYQPPQKPKYKIKDELPELGGKWLALSDIKKIDLSEIETVKTGFYELDKLIVGLNMSEVSLLSGSNGSGKSSLLNTLLLNVVNQNVNTALWSGELRADILKAWIQMAAAGKNNLMVSKYSNKYYVPNTISEKIDSWLDGKFFLYNNEYGCQWEQIFNDMQELLKANVKVFALDNLFSLNIDLLEGDKNNKQKELILQIKEFAKKNKVHIILVAHPRKVMTFIRKNDISGTSDITNAVDNVFIIHRVNNDFFRAGADFFGQNAINKFQGFGNVIEVCKNRMYGVVDLMVGLHYEVESRRFKSTFDESTRYGWDDGAPQQYAQQDMPFAETEDGDAPF